MTASRGWTTERRARQAALIHTWHPWTHSTGPRSPEGKAASARNAAKPDSIGRQLVALRAEAKRALARVK